MRCSTMRLQVLKNTVQQDRLNPPAGEEGELVYWKRVRSEGAAVKGDVRHLFDVLLDLRSRILTVRMDEHQAIAAAEVADGLVNAMCAYIPVPKSRLFIQRAVTDRTHVEWMVTDAIQVSGLLHRLKEAKEFDALTEAPYPKPLVPLLDRLVQAVISNMRMMSQWQVDRQYTGRMSYYIRFDRHDWDVLHPRFVESTDDATMLARFAQFFDLVQLMNPIVGLYLSRVGPTEHFEPWKDQEVNAAVGTLRHFQDDAERLGHAIIEAYGTPTARNADLGPIYK